MKRYNLEALLQEVLSQCKELNIPVSDRIIPEVDVNSRAKSRFGSCRKVWKNKEGKYCRKAVSPLDKHWFLIEIAEAVLDADAGDIRNILAHEVLHTCYGCYNHGKRWKSYAEKMNDIYGYSITVTSSYEKMGLERPGKQPEYRYVIECRRCGRRFYRQKKSKVVTATNRYRCSCGGKLECSVIENDHKV